MTPWLLGLVSSEEIRLERCLICCSVFHDGFGLGEAWLPVGVVLGKVKIRSPQVSVFSPVKWGSY